MKEKTALWATFFLFRAMIFLFRAALLDLCKKRCYNFGIWERCVYRNSGIRRSACRTPGNLVAFPTLDIPSVRKSSRITKKCIYIKVSKTFPCEFLEFAVKCKWKFIIEKTRRRKVELMVFDETAQPLRWQSVPGLPFASPAG